MKLQNRWIALVCLLLASVPCFGMDEAYVAEIQKWRRDFDSDVRTGGWLAVVERVKVEMGKTSLGSDPAAGVVLPAHVPRQVGILIREAGAIRFEPSQAIDVSVDGKPVSSIVEISTQSGKGRITTGSLKLAVRAVGSDFYLFVQDAENPAINSFTGTTWFEVDPTFRVNAKFVTYAKPEKVSVALTHSESMQEMESTGDLVFVVNGKNLRLKSFVDDDQLFVMFQDETNGKETYGGGRFLHVPLPKDGHTTLDFNKAFNPYCSVNEHIMCPIPLPGSRMGVRIPAGETFAAP